MISESQIVPYAVEDLPVAEGPWLVLAPHADDESFGMGGTLAKATERGISVELVVMTDGALGGNQANLAEIRRREALRASAVLGLNSPVFLENRDRGLQFSEGRVAEITAQIERVGPAAVFFPGVFELHPDHRITAALAWEALRKPEFKQVVPVSYEVLVQSPVNTLVDVTPYYPKKKQAMAAYESQLQENRYMEITGALNSLRTATLAPGILYAEGFFRFTMEEKKLDLADVIFGKMQRIFER